MAETHDEGREPEHCLHCEKPRYCRGLCKVHYTGLVRAINEGLTSWRKAEKAGAVLPKYKRVLPAFARLFPMLAGNTSPTPPTAS